MGRVFPVSKAQAMAFVEMGCCIAEMNSEDVCVVEKLLEKHHLEGKYRYVGDKSFVKLINQSDFLEMKCGSFICAKIQKISCNSKRYCR